MRHLFKQQSIKELVKYNQWLLIICAVLSMSTALLSIHALRHHERWVIIPAENPDKRLTISAQGYSEVYLREWAMYVMQTLMTTSHDTVESQVAALKVIASNSNDLNQFFKKHVDFVKGSNIQSVFFPKKVTFEPQAVLVSGLFRYWLGTSEKVISQEKIYRLSYKRGVKDLLLLKEVKEESYAK